MSIWEELGIERTDNAREIKKAYAAKLKFVHPEEHPEEFQKLHEAYKLALNIAKYQANMPKRQAAPVLEKKEKPPVTEKTEETIDFDFKRKNEETANEDSPDSQEKPIAFDFKNRNEKSDETENEDSTVKRDNPFDFDSAIKRNTLRHDNEVMEKAEVVLKKAADLYNKKLFSSKQDWMDIFSSDAVEEIRYEPIFICELCRFLKSHRISENMANAIFSTFKLYDYMAYHDNSDMEELYNLIIGAKGESLNRLEASIKLFKILVTLFSIGFFVSLFTSIIWMIISFLVCLGGSIIGLIVLKGKRKKFYE